LDPGSLSQLCGHFFKQGGPTLRIEFSRVSEDGRLTLVIDRENGADVPTRVATSTRSTLDDAVTDVWIRETRFFGERSGAEKRSKDGTIGYADLAGENASIKIHPDHQYAYDLITPWLKTSGFDAVVWTALRSNFKDFSVEEAVNYLKSLPRTFHSEKASQQDAFEYIVRAPEEVETPLRKRLRDLGLIPRMPSPNDIIGAAQCEGSFRVLERLGYCSDYDHNRRDWSICRVFAKPPTLSPLATLAAGTNAIVLGLDCLFWLQCVIHATGLRTEKALSQRRHLFAAQLAPNARVMG
jgi:hypothetical protein